LKETGWPQVTTTLSDHVAPDAHVSGVLKDSGKYFKPSLHPLPKELKQRLVEMKLEHCKKAGTISNQRATAATAWVLMHASSNFSTVSMAWTGV